MMQIVICIKINEKKARHCEDSSTIKDLELHK